MHLIGTNGMLTAIAKAIIAVGDRYLMRMISGDGAMATGTVCREQRTRISCPRPLPYPQGCSSYSLISHLIRSACCMIGHVSHMALFLFSSWGTEPFVRELQLNNMIMQH